MSLIPANVAQETPMCDHTVLIGESLPQNWSHIFGKSTPLGHEEQIAGT